jgi:hypothetical protein
LPRIAGPRFAARLAGLEIAFHDHFDFPVSASNASMKPPRPLPLMMIKPFAATASALETFAGLDGRFPHRVAPAAIERHERGIRATMYTMSP